MDNAPLDLQLLKNSVEPEVWAREFIRTVKAQQVDPLNEFLMKCWFQTAMEAARRELLIRLAHGKEV